MAKIYNPGDLKTNESGAIPPTLDLDGVQIPIRAEVIRNCMENKNLLSTVNTIYVGTGNTTTVTPAGDQNTYLVAKTEAKNIITAINDAQGNDPAQAVKYATNATKIAINDGSTINYYELKVTTDASATGEDNVITFIVADS